MPLILTLGFDEAGFSRFDSLRRRWFPSDLNPVPAHLTLFQQLPENRLAEIFGDLGAVASRTPPLRFTVSGVMDFPRGAALQLDLPGFADLHGALRRRWAGRISPADDRRRTPHVTVQNKAGREAARMCQTALRAGATGWDGVADRLLLWHYRDGPWEAAARFDLEGAPR